MGGFLLAPLCALLVIVLALAVLTYGGVSLFVAALAVYPMAAALFRQPGRPKRLIAANVVLGLLQRRQLAGLKVNLESGTTVAVPPLPNTALQVGYGAAIASLAGFALVRAAVLGIAPDKPLVSMSIEVNMLAGITGSTSGDMRIAPEQLHRVTAIANGGPDSLPHSGSIITLLGRCRLNHRQSALDNFMVAVAAPVLALLAVMVPGSALGSF